MKRVNSAVVFADWFDAIRYNPRRWIRKSLLNDSNCHYCIYILQITSVLPIHFEKYKTTRRH